MHYINLRLTYLHCITVYIRHAEHYIFSYEILLDYHILTHKVVILRRIISFLWYEIWYS